MEKQHTILLPNRVPVKMFYKNKETLDQMLSTAQTEDFLKETETMKRVGNFPPFNLLVYDTLLALGLYASNDNLHVALRPYSEESLLDWTDMALSLRKHPIRVVEKTTHPGEMFQQLKPRTDLDFIQYDPTTQVIRERDISCPARKCLESMPLSKDLYSLVLYQGTVEVVHMRINPLAPVFKTDGSITYGQCEEMGRKRYPQTSLEQVEEILHTQDPNALVLREPLTYCSISGDAKEWACLAVVFEEVYAGKLLRGETIPRQPRIEVFS